MTSDSTPIRFGLVGVDSSHAVQFTRLLGDGRGGAVTGGTVAAAWRGQTIDDFPPSADRNDALAAEVADLGVPFVDDPAAIAGACDVLLLISSDVRTHAELLRRVAPAGKPVFVDTRFALTSDTADEMLAFAAEAGCDVFAGSPKRFTPEFTSAASRAGQIDRIDLTGALPEQPHHPFLAWYGVHLIDLAVAALGAQCTSVDATGDRVELEWADGRHASLGGPREWAALTAGVVSGTGGAHAFEIEAREQMHVGLLKGLIEWGRTGVTPVPADEVRMVVTILEAASRSRELGRRVALSRPNLRP